MSFFTTLLGIPAQGRHNRAPMSRRPLLLTRPPVDACLELINWLRSFRFRGSIKTLRLAGFREEAIEWVIRRGYLVSDGVGYCYSGRWS